VDGGERGHQPGQGARVHAAGGPEIRHLPVLPVARQLQQQPQEIEPHHLLPEPALFPDLLRQALADDTDALAPRRGGHPRPQGRRDGKGGEPGDAGDRLAAHELGGEDHHHDPGLRVCDPPAVGLPGIAEPHVSAVALEDEAGEVDLLLSFEDDPDFDAGVDVDVERRAPARSPCGAPQVFRGRPTYLIPGLGKGHRFPSARQVAGSHQRHMIQDSSHFVQPAPGVRRYHSRHRWPRVVGGPVGPATGGAAMAASLAARGRAGARARKGGEVRAA
jgi:hypothetical protein